ncbi:MAG: hypothetical protein AB1505_13010 [Candidatus Latescibacterota bacterium]
MLVPDSASRSENEAAAAASSYAYLLPYDERYPTRGDAAVLSPSRPVWTDRRPNHWIAPRGVHAAWFKGETGFARAFGWEWIYGMVLAPGIGMVLVREGYGSSWKWTSTAVRG